MQVSDQVLDLMRERTRLYEEMGVMRTRVKEIDGTLSRMMVSEESPYASFRYGPWAVRIRPKTTMKVIPETEGVMMEWLSDTAPLRRLASFSALRIGQVKEVANESFRHIDEATGEIHQGWVGFRDTYLETTYGESELAMIPSDKAPIFLQKLEEGRVVTR